MQTRKDFAGLEVASLQSKASGLRPTRSDWWPVCFMMLRSEAPPTAAEVARPERSEWPA